MKFREIFRHEISHRLRSASTWLYLVFFFGIAFATIVVAAGGDRPTHANAASLLALMAIIIGMLGMLVSAAIFGDAAIRDHDTQMAPLIFTTPIRKLDYLGGRFLAALVVNAVVLLGIPLGQAIATLMPFVPAPTLGPFVGGAFVQAYLIFLLPNLVITSAILFAIAVVTKETIPVYLAAIVVFIGYIVALNYPTGNAIGDLLTDPLGIRALNEVVERWTPAERNARLIGVPPALLIDRAVWLAIAAIILAMLHRHFRFAHATLGRTSAVLDRARGWLFASAATRAERSVVGGTTAASMPKMHGVFNAGTALRQTLEVARRGVGELATGRIFLLIFIGKIALTAIFGWDAGETVFDTSITPVTILVIERLADTPLVGITYLLVTLFAGELIWNDRRHAMAAMSDAAPMSESAALVGRFIALVAILAILQLPVMIGGVLAQVLQGYTHLQVGVYVRILFGLQLAEIVLVAALAVLVHVVVNQKYLAHLVVVALLILRTALGLSGHVQHHLLLYGTDPGWKYSGMNGFGPFIRAVVWFKLYWAAWAAMLLIVAALLWVRGHDTSVRRRLSRIGERFTPPLVRASATAAVLIVMLGGFVFYNTNVLNEYRTADERGRPQAEYEKRYGRYLDVPQPTIVGATLRVEMHPELPSAELRGTYRLVNRTSVPIDSVHVVVDDELQVRALMLGRMSREVVSDTALGYHIFALDRPLEPGDSTDLHLDLVLERRGFSNSQPTTALAGNGTWLDRRYLPFIGYQPVFELTDKETRERFGLPARKPAPRAQDPGNARLHLAVRNDADFVHLDAIVGTSADQTPITPGLPRREWTENGRRYVEYETAPPTDIGGGFFSARYATREDRWDGVTLKVFHDPSDRTNVDRMLHGMKAALAYYTASFGPYPDSLLELMEIPRYSVFGIALPFGMAFSEDAFHSNVKNGEIDQPFYGAAHETAHHWWGGMVRPAPVKGSGVLSESLANYSAMMLIEKTFGLDAARRVYQFQLDRYFRGRAESSREVPLIDVQDQAYLTYRKGAVAMYTMRDQIGEEAVNTALRRYVKKFSHDGGPYATAADLIAELRAVTPDSLQSLITDLFEDVVLWEVKMDKASVQRTPDGKYAVTLDVDARKVRADSIGRQSDVSMNDLVEIGVFGKGDVGMVKPLYLERRRIHSGKQSIRVIVGEEPARAGIDPYDKLIDRQRADNVRDVSPVGRSGPEAPAAMPR